MKQLSGHTGEPGPNGETNIPRGVIPLQEDCGETGEPSTRPFLCLCYCGPTKVMTFLLSFSPSLK